MDCAGQLLHNILFTLLSIRDSLHHFRLVNNQGAILPAAPVFKLSCQTYLYYVFQAQTARNSSWVTIYEVNAPDAQSILVNGLVPFTTYRLRVIATNVVGSSAPSEPCKEFQTIQAPPRHPPRNVTVRAVSATNLRVRWIVSEQCCLTTIVMFI